MPHYHRTCADYLAFSTCAFALEIRNLWLRLENGFLVLGTFHGMAWLWASARGFWPTSFCISCLLASFSGILMSSLVLSCGRYSKTRCTTFSLTLFAICWKPIAPPKLLTPIACHFQCHSPTAFQYCVAIVKIALQSNLVTIQWAETQLRSRHLYRFKRYT